MVIVCGGPKGTGMQEVAQITIAVLYIFLSLKIFKLRKRSGFDH